VLFSQTGNSVSPSINFERRGRVAEQDVRPMKLRIQIFDLGINRSLENLKFWLGCISYFILAFLILLLPFIEDPCFEKRLPVFSNIAPEVAVSVGSTNKPAVKIGSRHKVQHNA
jgi:hypothetical protein